MYFHKIFKKHYYVPPHREILHTALGGTGTERFFSILAITETDPSEQCGNLGSVGAALFKFLRIKPLSPVADFIKI